MRAADLTVDKLKEHLPNMTDLELGRTRKALTHKDRDGVMSEGVMELCAWMAQEYKRRGYHAGTQLLPKNEQKAVYETAGDE
tara:strand:- start:5617 stop:5862 length:246 start_codon:yes stop_codon:yes gene_type:complete